jgi:hypothetical protein
MAFTIQPDHQGRWHVFRDGVLVFFGDYCQVEDWLDLAENCAGSVTVSWTAPITPSTNSSAIVCGALRIES